MKTVKFGVGGGKGKNVIWKSILKERGEGRLFVVEKVNDTWAVVKVCLNTIIENCTFTGFLMRGIEIVSERP